MPRQSTLTPEQWALARRRWEGSEDAGFEWLRREIEAAFGTAPSRPAIRQAAVKYAWEKGGPQSHALSAGDVSEPAGAKVSERAPAKVSRASKREIADHVEGSGEPPQHPPPATRPEQRGRGRPTSYRPEFATAMITYFSKAPFTTEDVPQPNGLVKRQRMATDPPMLQGFAESIGVTKATVDNWATAINADGSPRYPDFCEAYACARASQEALFARAAMLGLYEPRFTSFTMKNLCGWQDQPAPKVDQAAVSKEALERLFGERMEAARQRAMAVLQERRELRRLADEAAGVGPLAQSTELGDPDQAGVGIESGAAGGLSD
jgi:hypothetical protein